MMQFYARTQKEIRIDLAQRMRDVEFVRWTQHEYYQAINHTLQVWAGKGVLLPFVYSLTDGFDTNARQYTLPDYVRPPLDVQFQLEGEDFWRDTLANSVIPTQGTSKAITLAFYPPSADARVVWWANNSVVPTIEQTLSATITSGATSLVVASSVEVNDTGFVKVDQEWMQYAGRTRGASTTTLSNLVRGVFDTTAASHTSAVAVYWGVAVNDMNLYGQMAYEAIAYLHGLYLNDSSPTEKENHQFSLRLNKQYADEFWKSYIKARRPSFRLSREEIGDIESSASSYPWTFGDYGRAR